MMRLLKTLRQFAPKLTPSQLTIDEISLYETNLQRIIDRNNKARFRNKDRRYNSDGLYFNSL